MTWDGGRKRPSFTDWGAEPPEQSRVRRNVMIGIFLSFKFVGKTESKTDLKFASVLESDRGTLTVVVGNMDARFKAYRLKLNESVKINDSELDMVLFVNGEPAEVWLYDGSVYKVTEWVELPVEVVEGM